jgi:DNA (cytosine-5)-methyltransferase 1
MSKKLKSPDAVAEFGKPNARRSASVRSIAPRVVDLFSGCGGMSLGFSRAGFSVVAAFDAWESAVQCYAQNFEHPVQKFDLSDVDLAVDAISPFQPDVIIGGPPCQDFSSAGKRVEMGRADLTYAYAKIIERVRPQAFVMENVERARLSVAYSRAREIYVASGYNIHEVVLDASFFGVPQQRKRFFCIGLLNHNVQEVAASLAEQASQERMTIRHYLGTELGVSRYYRHPRNYSRRAIYSIDEPSATVRGVNRPVPPGYPGHPLDAGPVTPDLRPLTTLERARIQTFPKSFKFDGTKSDLELLIGNAVPVELASAVGRAVLRALRG